MLPLTGIRILSVEQYGAGPFGTQFLADLGAEVIKIENPHDGGDSSRGVGPFFVEGAGDSSASLFFQGFNRNKRSFSLDLRSEAGRKVFHDLVGTADAVASNLRGDVPEKLGLTYKTLGTVNPKIVCGHLTAYGREGPRATWPGYDFPMQAETGYMMVTGDPGGTPARAGLSLVDYMAGMTLSFSLLAGLLSVRATGKGRDLDVNLFDTALFNLNYLATWYLNTGHNQGREPRSAHASMTPCQLYTTRDGWIFIMCNKEKFWGVLCRAVGRPEWIEDGRFRTFKDRLVHRDLITELLDGELSKKTTAEWLATFAGTVPSAPVLDVAQALENPFVTERGRVQTVQHESGKPVRLLACPVHCAGETLPDRAAPPLGRDTDALLSELGYDEARIAELRKGGVI